MQDCVVWGAEMKAAFAGTAISVEVQPNLFDADAVDTL